MYMEKNDKVYFILDRHPESMGNKTGDNRNDATLGITELGKEQARAEADFLMFELFPKIGVTHLSQVDIWVSEYTRVHQGLNEKLKRMHEINPDFIDFEQGFLTDDALMERNFGKLPYVDHLVNDLFQNEPEIQKVILADLEASRMVREGTPHSAKPELGESPKEISAYVKQWRDSAQRNIDEGRPFHWVNTHGEVINQIRAKQLHQYSVPMPTPGNCDVVLISGQPKNMTVQLVYKGEEMRSNFDSPRYFARPKRVKDMPFAQDLDL